MNRKIMLKDKGGEEIAQSVKWTVEDQSLESQHEIKAV